MIQLEVIDEIRAFRLARGFMGRALYSTAAYWVDGLMIDTGCAATVAELGEALRDLPVDTIVNTHSHEDHVAGNAAVQQRSGARIFAHEAALPVLADPARNPLHPYRRVVWGSPPPSTGSAIGSVVETASCRFRVIGTPGHSPDHISLYEPERKWLFSGDAFVGGRDKALRSDCNIRQVIQSLKLLESLEVNVLFPGSGSVRRSPNGELRAKIDYLESTGEQVLTLHKRGWSLRRIRKALLGPELPIAYYTLGHFSGLNLVRSYIEDR